MNDNFKNLVNRIILYIIGLFLLAVGIILNTKTGLGVSPIVSVAYCISGIFDIDFGNVTLINYIIFVIIQLVLRYKKIQLKDLLQIPLSLIFSRILIILNTIIVIPEAAISKYLILMLAVILTGIGATLSIQTKLVPNPPDGLVEAISEMTGYKLGFVKKIFDLVNLIITMGISILFNGSFFGIGIGTVVSMVGVGQVINWFDNLMQKKLWKGVERL